MAMTATLSEKSTHVNMQMKLPKKTTATELKKTTAEKDLGVTIDNRLTFSEQIINTVKKAKQVMGMIRRTLKFIDKEIFALLFKSRVRPILEYGNTTWSPRLKKNIDASERVQRRATSDEDGTGSGYTAMSGETTSPESTIPNLQTCKR